MKGGIVMFDKIRCTYHTTCLEKMNKNNELEGEKYDIHKRKANELFLKAMMKIAVRGSK